MQVRQTEPLGDRAIDDVFVRFGTTSRPRKITWWVRNLYRRQAEPLPTLGERLTERGILTASEHRALWVIKWTTYPVLEPAYGQKLHKQIRAAVMGEEPVEPELAILISLLHNGKALNRVLSASEIVNREHRIATIAAAGPGRVRGRQSHRRCADRGQHGQGARPSRTLWPSLRPARHRCPAATPPPAAQPAPRQSHHVSRPRTRLQRCLVCPGRGRNPRSCLIF